MSSEEVTATGEGVSGAGSRRGALAAMLAGTALGLSSLGGAVSPDAEARKKNKGKKKNRKGASSNGNSGNGNSGNGNPRRRSLPSLKYVETRHTIGRNDVFSGVAQCPPDYLPIGGGFTTSFDDAVLLGASPNVDDREWEIEIGNAVEDENLTVFAICLKANDDSDEQDAESNGASRNRGKRKRSRKN